MSDPEGIRKVFNDVLQEFQRSLSTKLTVIVCGPRSATEGEETPAFADRRAVRDALRERGDVAFFIEEILDSDEGRRLKATLRGLLGYDADLARLEVEILRRQYFDKDVHLLEGVGAILELRDFVEDPLVMRKVRVFVQERHRNSDSYVNQTLIRRLLQAGGQVVWYEDRGDLINKVIQMLRANRLAKFIAYGRLQ